MNQTDIVIIGAGPVGLFTIFQCGMLKMRCHVVDVLPMVGGQCSALYPQKPIYDIPAHPAITAQGLIDNLKKQAEPFHPTYHLEQKVTDVVKNDDGFIVTTDKGTQIQCKAAIIAAGGGSFGPNRPPIDGLDAFEGKSVFYLVDDKERFRGKDIVIAGGGDSAVDWAVELAEIAKSVQVVHRRAKFRAAPDSVEKMETLVGQGKIDMVTPYTLKTIHGNDGELSSVVVADLDGNEKTLDADCLLAFYGLASDLGVIENWGMKTDGGRIVVNPATCQTSVDGLFAVGDITQYDGKMKLILQGFSEGAVAAHAAFAVVYPDEMIDAGHSTDKGVCGL